MDAATLKIARPEDEQQAEFPFGGRNEQIVLAIPDADLDLWRGRADVIRRPGFFAVRYDIISDPRWSSLRGLADRAGLTLEYAAGVLWMAAGCALRCDPPGSLTVGGRPMGAADLIDFWRGGDLRGMTRALACCVAAGWLESRQSKTGQVDHTYVPVRARTGPDVRVRARTGTSVDGARTGTSVDGRTDRQTDIDVDDGRKAKNEHERTTTDRTDPTMRQRMGEKPPAALQTFSSRNGFWRDVAVNDRLTALEQIAFRLIEFRGEQSLKLYPNDERDRADLNMAVRRATERGTVGELLKLLERCAHQCDSGAGFRTALRRGGFLPELEK